MDEIQQGVKIGLYPKYNKKEKKNFANQDHHVSLHKEGEQYVCCQKTKVIENDQQNFKMNII